MDAISYSRALKPHPNMLRSSGGERLRVHDEHDISRKVSRVFRSIIVAIVSRYSSPEVLPCGFSFPGSQSFSCGDC
jgi:hypothetical protein